MVIVRVEGRGLIVMDAQRVEGARKHEGLLHLQLGPLDVIGGACTAMLVFLSRENAAKMGSRA